MELSNHAAEQYRNRLENVSNSWMVATVTTLDKHARDVMANIGTEAETNIRETCSHVFESLGDTLKSACGSLPIIQARKAKDAHA